MWFKDFPEHDPNSNYPAPSAKQVLYEAEAHRYLKGLKRALSHLTVPQQRAIFAELSGRVFKNEAAAGNEHSIKNEYPAHESEGQALTEAAQTDD